MKPEVGRNVGMLVLVWFDIYCKLLKRPFSTLRVLFGVWEQSGNAECSWYVGQIVAHGEVTRRD